MYYNLCHRYHNIYQTNGRNAATRILDFVGNIHDIESYQSIQDGVSLNQLIFTSHWGHLAVILLWVSGNLFHIGWTGNFAYWVLNPISTIPISHSIWDPHIAASSSYLSSVPSYSGLYNWLYAAGFTHESEIYRFVLVLECLSLASLLLGKFHLSRCISMGNWLIDKRPVLASQTASLPFSKALIPIRYVSTYMDNSGLRLNFHLSSLIGVSSLLWSGHIIHVSLPVSRCSHPISEAILPPLEGGLISSFFSGNWSSYLSHPDAPNHLFGSSYGSGTSLLTFIGGISPTSASLHMTDISHHHLSIGVIFIWSGHLYSSLFKALGHRASSLLSSSGLRLSSKYILKSVHLQLSLALGSLSVLTSVVSGQIYSLPAYPYISYDYVTSVALYVHHNWIASFLMVGSFSHATLFLIRDYTGTTNYSGSEVIARLLSHKPSIISHLSWVTLFLGFHVLGIYVHNDSVVSFGEAYKQLLIEPSIAHLCTGLLNSTTKCYGAFGSTLFSLPMTTYAPDLCVSSLGPGDFLAYHSIALGFHVTTLILLKGALDSRGSSLMPDKVQIGYGFACDGPARGGTCDISSWDSFYLALFWGLNANSWLMFYFHWKHLLVWQGSISKFEESSTYLNGWFRDYLWFNSSSLIRGYDAVGSNSVSVWAWSFLAAHLCWATGFMFLISWRGYWQEILDTILYMHLKSPFLYSLWDGKVYTPIALSIVQARFIGLVHFSSGLIVTYAAFVLGVTS